jgi:hypothetical protein
MVVDVGVADVLAGEMPEAIGRIGGGHFAAGHVLKELFQ